MGIGAAIAGSAVIGAGASIAGADKASSTAKSTAAANNALESQIYNQNAATLAPYESAGGSAEQQLLRTLGLGDSNTGKSVNGNPALSATDQYNGVVNWLTNQGQYKTGLTTADNATEAALGAKGLLDSGSAAKSLQANGMNYFQNYYDNYVNQLSSVAGSGLTAASAQAGVGQNYANSVSANNNAASTATGNAALSSANSVNGALGSALTAYGYNSALGSSYNSGISQSALNTVENAGAVDGVEAPTGSYWAP